MIGDSVQSSRYPDLGAGVVKSVWTDTSTGTDIANVHFYENDGHRATSNKLVACRVDELSQLMRRQP